MQAAQVVVYSKPSHDNGENGDPERIITMDKDVDTGVFRAVVSEELYGKYYTYRILKDEKWLSETPGIWVKAVGVNGNRGAIIRMQDTDPEGWDKDIRPPLKNFTDIILYRSIRHPVLKIRVSFLLSPSGEL